MPDFTKPALTSTYTAFITELKERDEVVGSLYSTDLTVTGLPADNSNNWGAKSIRWNATDKYFQRRNAANNGWERLEGNSGTHKFINVEAKNITATGDVNSTVSGVNINASAQVQAARVNVTGTTKPANGLYRPASNEIRFTTNSQDRLTIESTGEIGINQVDPAFTLDITGTFRIQNGSNDSRLEVGTGGQGSSRSAYIDLVGDTNYTDYGLRLVRGNGGTNAISELIHRGTGNFQFVAVEGADMIFKTGNSTRMVIDAQGAVCIGNDTSPDDRLHIKEGVNTPVFMRVSNNEGYAKFGTDANHMVLDNDVINFRNRAGNTTYLISSSTLFDIKTSAKVNGRLEVTDNVMPSSGDSDSKGIFFPQNIGGGSGDKAFMRYYVDGSGENTRLHIGIRNDADDDLYLESELVHTSGNFSVNGTCTATSFSGNGASVTNVNATTLDGIDSGSFLRSDANDTASGVINFSSKKIGLGTTPGSTFNTRNAALCIGDNDTGIAQNGDGQLELWANNVEVVNIDSSQAIIYGNLVPGGSNRDLGTSASSWRNLYINDLNMSNKGSQNDVDGTWGDYTIQEGHEDLYLINHRTGKKFKFALIPVAN
tara:strand:+ start:5538 stop:7331 length:1794 start_codon:yes stop_codon:yes gene_type:complete